MEPGTPEQQPTQTPRKRPRLRYIVRALIYLPLLGFFGWQAAQTFIAQRHGADDNFRAYVHARLQAVPAARTIKLPNGESMPVLELTEQQAVEMGLLPEAASEAAAPAE